MLNSPVPLDVEHAHRARAEDLFRPESPPPSFAPVPLVLAVVIPTFNESGNVEKLLNALDVALFDRNWEAIFVDDGSTDGTPELIERIARERGCQIANHIQ